MYILIPVSLLIGFGAFILLLWAHKRGQFDDPEGPKYRMLDDAAPSELPAVPEKRDKEE